MTAIPPGSTLGILGSGQLGRMLAMAAAQLGYRVHIYAPESGPACDVSAAFTQGDYDDPAALFAFADQVDAITFEFENVEPVAIAQLGARRPTRPHSLSLDIARYRVNEKEWAARIGAQTAPWRAVSNLSSLKTALDEIGTPAILKTTLFGYDGKGQARISDPADSAKAWEEIGSPTLESGFPAILEGHVRFFAEFSVIVCRGVDGSSVAWDVPENLHRNGILATSTVPAREAILAQAEKATAYAIAMADKLGHVGVLTCEFFATADGPVFNEMAPRVHNSGHWTIEGAETSQFENHVRAVLGLPLGPVELTGASVEMQNLIGDEVDAWHDLLAQPGAHLHLYGKNDARPGRKMGHVTRLRR
ncbi:5-(carboxyamino)imidazole ribonucleotide synthase [Sphingomonas sp. ST-64]|uniref:N5-carboxyaminoimidazole ribonucleotide synthase n=1 Tax=Sphingomonas plantiphila TaxID=3163295 RepID=A0ABW8YKJ3_9SPHN